MGKKNPTILKQDQPAQTWFSSTCLNRLFLRVSPKQIFFRVFLKKKTFFHLRVFQNKVLSFSKYPEMSLDFLICESSHSSVKNLTKLWKCHSRNFFARSSEGLVTCLKHSLEARLPHWQYKKANQAYIQGELWTISSFIKSCPEWSLHLT